MIYWGVIATIYFKIFCLNILNLKIQRINIQNCNLPIVLYRCGTLFLMFFFNLHSGGWKQGPLNGLLCQPWVIMIMEKSVE
jgi:hypothetical protein